MDKKVKFFHKVGKTTYAVLLRWLILALSAVFLMWYLQYRIAGNNADAAWGFWDEKPAIFWYSSAIIFTLLLVIYGVSYGPFRALGIAFALITIITYINNTKVAFRGTPLLPEDFQLADQAGTLTSFIDVGELTRVILASIISIGLGFLLDYICSPRLRYLPKITWKSVKKKPKTKKAIANRKKQIRKKIIYAVAPRLIITPIAVLAFIFVSSPVLYHDGSASQEFEWLDNTEMVAWNQTLNYEQNGFLLGFIYNLKKLSLEKPKDYSSAEIAKIKSTYEKEAAKTINANKKELKNADYNIVLVLNESFYDPTIIQQTYDYTGVDPLQIFHKIMGDYPSGYMYSPDYGGGTANIEFEVDTGLSNYWAQTVPYTDILPKINNIVSIAKEAKDAGYKTTAIHSFSGGMYKRNFALPKEGFDTFITQDQMHHTDKAGSTGGYISDRSTYRETLDLLKDSKEKQLVSVITMQNHAPYYKDHYSEEEYEFEFSDPNIDENTREIILAYIQSVHYSDTFLGEFLEDLLKLDEKTVVLFFGDHAPGIFGDANKSNDENIANLTHLTPYFIWANFEFEDKFSNRKYGEEFLAKFGDAYDHEEETVFNKETKSYEAKRTDTIAELADSVTLPTTTPNCLTNALYGVLGLKRNAEKMLLEQVCSENPILTSVYLGDSSPSGKATHDYELLNYDLLGGEQYWFK